MLQGGVCLYFKLRLGGGCRSSLKQRLREEGKARASVEKRIEEAINHMKVFEFFTSVLFCQAVSPELGSVVL